jgi:drug/metabolite transporter (DMT)-like permease
MPKWLFYSVLATLLWAIWGVIPKAASKALADQPLLMQVISTMGLLPVALTFASSKTLLAASNLWRGIAFAFVAGLCGGLGNIALLEALKRGGAASIVLPLTGVYPLVTVLLAWFFLKEKLNTIQSVGIGIAAVALYLFSVEENSALASRAHPWWRSVMSAWLTFALIALLLYGIAGITQKLATTYCSTALSTICFALAFLVVALLILFTQELDWNIRPGDWWTAILYGAVIGFAILAQFAAYSRGKAAIITALTALYPAITVILAVAIFHESLDLRKLLAIALSLAAGVALSYETKPIPSTHEPASAPTCRRK